MTGRANSLTARATALAAGSGSAMTMAAHDLRVFLESFERLGYQAARLLEGGGISPADLAATDARVPCDALGAVVGRAQQERFRPNLALELAQVTPLGAWPLIDYLVLTTDTIGAGVEQLVRYFRVVGAPVAIDVDRTVEPIRIGINSRWPFMIEFEAALMILRFQQETDGVLTASISFQHAPDDPAAFARIIGGPVAVNASWSGVSLGSEVWNLALRRRDPILRGMLEEHANAILARLPLRTGLALEVQRALTRSVAGGDTRIAAIGRQFGMSSRSLQRLLAAEGVSFQKLLDAARKDAAGQLLVGSTLAIGEIAYLLGYAEPASFHRAFKRWHARTPEAFRSNASTRR